MTRDTVPLLIAVVASLSIHIAVIPLFANQQFDPPFAPPSDASHLETPPVEEDEVTLGIESSEGSTLTWIGYDQYHKHLARLAPVEQAAMQIKQPPPQAQPPEFETEHSKKTVQAVLEDLSNTTAPIIDIVDKLLKTIGELRFSSASQTPPPSAKPATEQEPTVDEEPQTSADAADLEADPTSIVEVPRANWKTGRPLAAEGIILRPRRPSFTAHQTVTNAPGGLTAVLVIDYRGRPVNVEVVRGTGSSSIDRSLVASLYRWRAAGEKIDVLVDDQTLRITIHISFAR